LKRRRQVAAFILAGGASSRMGRDKGLLDFGGVPLIVHLAHLIEPHVASVTVVGSPRRYAAMGCARLRIETRAGKVRKEFGAGP
jgi:molybdenum cofactor guanylyltransferase